MKRIIALCLALCAGIAILYVTQGNTVPAATHTGESVPAPSEAAALPVPTPPQNEVRRSVSVAALPVLSLASKAEPVYSLSPACRDPYPDTSQYVLNTKSHKFHLPACRDLKNMNPSNRKEYQGTVDELTAMGYKPCGHCRPE